MLILVVVVRDDELTSWFYFVALRFSLFTMILGRSYYCVWIFYRKSYFDDL